MWRQCAVDYAEDRGVVHLPLRPPCLHVDVAAAVQRQPARHPSAGLAAERKVAPRSTSDAGENRASKRSRTGVSPSGIVVDQGERLDIVNNRHDRNLETRRRYGPTNESRSREHSNRQTPAATFIRRADLSRACAERMTRFVHREHWRVFEYRFDFT